MTFALRDGTLVSNENFLVPALDRALLYGESAVEVLRVYAGRAFEAERHWARLALTCQTLGIEPPDVGALRADVATIEGALPTDVDFALRVMVTKGNAARGVPPSRLLSATPAADMLPPASAYQAGGVALVLAGAFAEHWPFPGSKWGGYAPRIALREWAAAEGAVEALLSQSDGALVEGATSNVFAMEGGALWTPGGGHGVREGVTREVVIELARDRGVDVVEEPITRERFARSTELFLTSSVREIVPIARVGDRALPDSTFPVARALHAALRQRAGSTSPMPWEIVNP